MTNPQRGEIWRVKWGGKQGTELGAGKVYDERPCLIVSLESFYIDEDGQRVSDRLTVVPLTHYEPRKEVVRSLWSAIITNRDDVHLDPRNTTQYPEELQLKLWDTDRYGNRIPYQSIIDCGQISTVYATSLEDLNNDLCWDFRYGKLRDEKILSVDAALQIVLGGSIHYDDSSSPVRTLPVREGDVLTVRLPERNLVCDQKCLVVSSPGIDVIREYIEVEMGHRKPKRKLRHCTVIPLEEDEKYKSTAGLADVLVYPKDDPNNPELAVAVCGEIYTLDWWARGGLVIGQVYDEDMSRVRKELGKYLDLPL
jgi:mRNA-degrading endonuclease toxin of MazEF toxin-antitoxin module